MFTFNRLQIYQWLAVGMTVVLLLVGEYLGIFQPLFKVSDRFRLWLEAGVVRVVRLVESPVIYFERSWTAAGQVRELEEDYSRVLAELTRLETVDRENQELRQILQNSDRLAVESVITYPITSFANQIVAVGSEDGVAQGQPVMIAGTLVGVIAEVDDNSAELNLLSQPLENPVLVETENGVAGVVTGKNNQVVLTEVFPEETVTLGERVVTSGQPGIRKGLLVGTAGKQISTPQSPVQTILINQAVNFYESPVVEIYK